MITDSLRESPSFHPPLSDELLLNRNFFELYPLDGGGALVSPTMVSSTGDAEFAQQVLDQDALRDFGTLPKLDHRRFERWRTGQKSCWINRFYWLVPLAKRVAITQDQQLAQLVIDSLLHFIDTCPPPGNEQEILAHMRRVYDRRDHSYNQATYEEIRQDETDIEYIWFDFEPASRLIHWIHILYFLQLGTTIDPQSRQKILASMYHHGMVIYYGEHNRRKLLVGDNHQSLRGIALMYAGAMFREMPLAEEFLRDGIRIMNFHSNQGFFEDGALTEISPSYHAFQVWHVRDALLLCRQCGLNLDPQVEHRLRSHLAYLDAVTTPDGKAVSLNDAYPLTVSTFLKSFDFLNHPSDGKDGTTGFADAGIWATRQRDLYFLMDASPFIGRASHHHCGKNAPVLWVGGKPLLVDSGCCPYDDQAYITWYRLGQAHSSMLVNGQGDGLIRGIWDIECLAETQCDGWQTLNDKHLQLSATMTGIAGPWEGVVWPRTATVKSATVLELLYTVRAPREATLTFVFNLHPDVSVTATGKHANYLNDSVEVCHRWESSTPCEAKVVEGKCIVGFREQVNQQLLLEMRIKNRATLKSTLVRAGTQPGITSHSEQTP